VLNELMVSANRTLSDVQALEEGRIGLVTLGATVSAIEAPVPRFVIRLKC